MANAVYDPETENQGAPGTYDPQKTPMGDPTDPRGDLRQAEDGGGFYNPSGDQAADKTAEPEELKDSEQAAGRGGFSYNPKDRGTFRQRAGLRVRGLVKNKWLVGLGLSGAGFLGLLFLLLILLGNFKIIQLAEHITAYQFARLTRNYAESVSQITAEDTAMSMADRNALQRAYSQFGNVRDRTWGSMWDKLNDYRPNKIVENMISDGTLDFRYERGNYTSLWQKKLTAVVVNGEEIPVSNPTRFQRYVHPLRSYQDRVAFSDTVNQSLAEAMDSRGSIIRGAVAKAIRDEYGIQLQWWKQLSEYRGADAKKAAALTEAEAEAEINRSISPANSAVNKISSAEQEAKTAVDACAADTACVKEVVDNGGRLPQRVTDAINKVADASIFENALGFVNPVYTVSLPVCLIYDGSLQGGESQGQTINNTNAQAQRTFYAVETAADQQKYGDTTAEAVGGMDWKLGDTSKSIPELRAGGANVNTSSQLSPQGSVTGDLGNTTSIFSFLPSPASDLANSLAGKACPVATSLWTGGVIGAVNLAVGFFSGETSTAAEDSLAKALTSYLAGFVRNVATKKEAAKMGLFVGGTEGLTILAKMLVAQKAGVANAGLATGPSFDNVADMGGNLNAQETARGFYGRPLNNTEVADATYRDQVFAAAMNGRQSTFERYFAINNPDSLVTKMGIGLKGHVNSSLFSNILSAGERLLNPLRSFGSLFSGLSPRLAYAADSADNQNYGIVQWGWSNAEENLIKNDPSYLPLENQKILQDSGQSDAIEQKYGICFSRDVQMGDMLTGGSPLITRAGNGNLTNDGLCSPAKLSYANGEFGRAMVFRWRVEKNYEVTLDQLENMQTVSSSVESAPSGGASVSGNAQQLAQDILNNNKISKAGRYVMEDLQNTAAGRPAYGNVNIAVNILQFMSELGQTTPFTITSITGAGSGHSPGSNHYSGHAVDFGCPFDESKGDEVARKYNLMAQNERCSNTDHSHFSQDGY